MILWKKYQRSFSANADLNAFCIANRYFTYRQFSACISGISRLLRSHQAYKPGHPVGVVCHNSIETFASIFACWFSGMQFVPLNPLHPEAVNAAKIRLTGLQLILDSAPEGSSDESQYERINTSGVKSSGSVSLVQPAGAAYILFTSGSTGTPKGVPISETNLHAFVSGFLGIYPELNADDRFLQTYELTSDAAFTGYLIPLLLGACVYTLPKDGFKYLNIVKLIQQYQISWTQFTPSVLNYLKPYLKSIRFDSLKHSHFGGEALGLELVSEWANCVPNAEISNIYGPTETTITCTIHRTSIAEIGQHVYQGIMSIGKPIGDVKICIVDEQFQELSAGQKGELCIAGRQLMEDYLSTSESQQSPFIRLNGERFYRSGDLAFFDEKGYLYFCGRLDDQLKINGYRIEPAEIELALSGLCKGAATKVYAFRNKSGTSSIVAFVEGKSLNTSDLAEQLRQKLAPALIPEKFIFVGHFPLNSNGKVDKSALFEIYSNQIYA